MPELSILDERLAEIDRRLRTIQSGLEPAEAPELPVIDSFDGADADEPVAPAHSPAPLPTPTPLRAVPDDPGIVLERLHDLQDAHERLLELHRELLSQYAEVLQLRAGATAGSAATVTAGPFSDAAAVRQFESALSTLPGVAGVSVREYLGADRVALDVHLAGG